MRLQKRIGGENLSIIMAGIDHTTAAIDLREKFAFTAKKTQQVMEALESDQRISGNVLLCTCNRTEWYFSCEEETDLNPAKIICRAAGIDDGMFSGLFTVKSDRDAALHLMEVASGLRSVILGEDQIVSQVKAAADHAREVKAADPALETLFRLAVTAAKKIKTEVRLKAVPVSAAKRAVELLEGQPDGIEGKKALIIGNGEMGRIAADLLVETGCEVTVTLRKYKHGETIVPYGCKVVEYDSRLPEVEKSQIVISATTSPHFTLTKEMLSGLTKKPEYIIDLAVPRDIDPEIAGMDGLRYYNIDTIGGIRLNAGNSEELLKCKEIIDEYLQRFEDWLMMKECFPMVGEIKRLAYHNVTESLLSRSDDTIDSVAFAVSKTVDMLIYSIKENLTFETLQIIKEKVGGIKAGKKNGD